jgi:signal transduction histidine kinase
MRNNASTENEIRLDELIRRLKEQEAALSLINSLQQAIVDGKEMQELYKLLGNHIGNLFGVHSIVISTFDEEKSLEIFQYVFEDGITHQIDPRPIDKLRRQIIEKGEPILINEMVGEKLTQLTGESPRNILGASKAKSAFYMPLTSRSTVKGYLSLQNNEKENAFSEGEVSLLSTVANSLSIALENEETNIALEAVQVGLRSTQEQLIQREKLASLGQLTAGIAHEIKNPLNFVNNFSDLNVELIEEIYEELKKLEENSTITDVFEILEDLKSNLKKIHQHGQRADGIVKSMLQQSRGGSGAVEPTDLNMLIKEYVNLSFHGMRAAKNAINVSLDLQLDENVGLVPLISEDFSRVILNLCNNAFDAMREKFNAKAGGAEYQPILTVKTFKTNGTVEIQIIDNGGGIPDELKDKILQPFFTTKKSTEGTGLGLSITNEIIKAHKGSLNVISEKNHYSSFNIVLNNLKLN